MNPHMREEPDDGASPQAALPLTGISSMATSRPWPSWRALYEARPRQRVVVESVGGVDVAGRVQAGERFDVVSWPRTPSRS